MVARSTRKGSSATVGNDAQVRERTAREAYALYEQRGRLHGHDLDDWLAAERKIVTELSVRPGKKAATKAPRNGSRVRRRRSELDN